MNTKVMNRRHLLRGAGGVAIGLPLLSAMLPRKARAAQAPKRFVVVFTPNGTNNPTQAGGAGTGAEPLSLGRELAPLAPLQRKVVVVSGLNNLTASSTPGAGANAVDLHALGMTHMLTGTAWGATSVFGPDAPLPLSYAGGISVDQEIARALPAATRFPSLEFGVQTTFFYGAHPFTRMSYLGAGRPAPPEDDPLAMFNRMFMQGGGTSAAKRILEQRRSVLDFATGDYTRLSAALGAFDRAKLQNHLQSVREIEARLQTAATLTGDSCERPAAPSNTGFKSPAYFPQTGRAQMDLLKLALECDMTRVASLQWSNARSHLEHTWVNANGSHHSISHGTDDASLALTLSINRWYTEQLAYLATAMDSVAEDNGTMLDNTLIYYCSEVAIGFNHAYNNLRAVLVGGAGGALRTGRVVSAGGKPHNALLVSFLNAMGIPATSFGDTMYGGTGPLPGLTA